MSLEILRFVPSSILKKPIEEMYIDELIHALAQARYIEELEENLMSRAIGKAFSKE